MLFWRLPGQAFLLTFKLAGPATTLGVWHGLVVLAAQRYPSGGCLISETTVKGGMSSERVLICCGPLGTYLPVRAGSFSSTWRDKRSDGPEYCILGADVATCLKDRGFVSDNRVPS